MCSSRWVLDQNHKKKIYFAPSPRGTTPKFDPQTTVKIAATATSSKPKFQMAATATYGANL